MQPIRLWFGRPHQGLIDIGWRFRFWGIQIGGGWVGLHLGRLSVGWPTG